MDKMITIINVANNGVVFQGEVQQTPAIGDRVEFSDGIACNVLDRVIKIDLAGIENDKVTIYVQIVE